MIEFIEKIQEVLPYDRERYIDFLEDEFEGQTERCGISFQLAVEEKEISLEKFVGNYENLFKSIILKLDRDSFWIINHDDKDLKWFPNEEDNLTSLRNLFKQNEIPNTFIGALIFMRDDLLKFSKDLISYPFTVFNEEGLLYKNLDISHSELQFIIKISGHRNIDFLSTDKELLKRIVIENSSSIFNVKLYNGTSL
jgi:hypothetical protein